MDAESIVPFEGLGIVEAQANRNFPYKWMASRWIAHLSRDQEPELAQRATGYSALSVLLEKLAQVQDGF
jgi:hypothetical protein